MKNIALFLLPVFVIGIPNPIFAQQSHAGETALLKGRLVYTETEQPATQKLISILNLRFITSTDGGGYFNFNRIPWGTHTLIIGGPGSESDTFKVLVNAEIIDLTDLFISYNNTSLNSIQGQQIPTIAMDEGDFGTGDEGLQQSNISGLLAAGNDPFLRAAAFIFGPYRFQPRGYERNQQQVLINGFSMNDVETNDAYWSQWGGLNDVFRSRSQTYGLEAGEYAFGGINGSVYFDATAATQPKQSRLTYSLSNRSYRNRMMLTHSTGLSNNGWSFSISGSRRWAKEGYVDGTFYDGYSYYAAASKRLNGKHLLSLIAFGAPTKKGKGGPAIQEVYELTGNNFYNANWGYQDGRKRNAKVGHTFQPVFMLSHEANPNASTRWNTSLGYQYGINSNSMLDWYNGKDPRPDYYRYLPSYKTLNNLDPLDAEFYNHQQLDWEQLYNVNYGNTETIGNVNGVVGNDITGKRSVYVLGSDVDEVRKWSLNTNLERVLNPHFRLSGGFTFMQQRTDNYKELLDLLGGDFYLNLNQFAIQQGVPNNSFNQYDTRHPNRLIRKGDRYNYNYVNSYTRYWAYIQAFFNFNRFDFFLSGQGGGNQFSREGLFNNGLFQGESYGKSEVQRFTTFAAKGGVLYKINGRSYLFLNGAFNHEAPTFENTFISSHTRNQTVTNPQLQKTMIAEGGYLLKTPKYNARLVGYVTEVDDATDIKRFYNDDPQFQTFVNYAMQNVHKRFIGTELAFQAQVSHSFTLGAATALGQAFYTDNPTVAVFRDNDTNTKAKARTVYVKEYYLGVGPQSAATITVNYRSRNFWFGGVNFNYFDRNYVSVNPDRRTAEAAEMIEPESALFHKIFDQEKLPAAYTMDVNISKSVLLSKRFKALPRQTVLNLSAGVTNLLNNKKIRSGGFEQLRYDFDGDNPDKFPSKYTYLFGANFFINVCLKF